MGEAFVRRELIVPGPAEALAGLLEVPLPDLEGEGLPPCWHWVYLLDHPRQSALGADGHLAAGGVPLPPGPGWKRMWAGGQIRVEGPLRIGQVAERRSWLIRSEEKRGRSGRFRLAEVAHEITQDGRVAVRERQDIVYREPQAVAPPTGEGEARAAGSLPGWRLPVDVTLLFRFSALTYNAHRIHYDREFATVREGYPGLVVHGPLQALAMAEALRPSFTGTSSPRVFDYRLVAPLYDTQGMRVLVDDPDGEKLDASVVDDAGRRTARGSLRPLADGEPDLFGHPR